MRLIDADVVEKVMNKKYEKLEAMFGYYDQYVTGYDSAIRCVEEAPTIEAEPVKHGKWVLNKHFGDYECSVCKCGDVTVLHFNTLRMNYCPNCGAKMDLEG